MSRFLTFCKYLYLWIYRRLHFILSPSSISLKYWAFASIKPHKIYFYLCDTVKTTNQKTTMPIPNYEESIVGQIDCCLSACDNGGEGVGLRKRGNRLLLILKLYFWLFLHSISCIFSFQSDLDLPLAFEIIWCLPLTKGSL